MSRLEMDASALPRSARREARPCAAAWGAAGWLGAGSAAWLVSAAACLPSEELSSYSSGNRDFEPGIALEEPTPGAAEVPAVSPTVAESELEQAAVPPSAAPLASSELSAELPLLVDAGTSEPAEGSGGSVAPVDVPVSGSDAGVPAPAADAAAVGPCGQGALLSPDERCFALLSTASSWSDARDACEARGAGWDLAVIRGAERNTLLAGMLGGVTDAWVGANDLAQEGSWRWVGDTNPFFTGTGTAGSAAAGAYVNWNTGGTPEPNGGAASDCLRLRASGGWADIACTTPFAALCEGPQP